MKRKSTAEITGEMAAKAAIISIRKQKQKGTLLADRKKPLKPLKYHKRPYVMRRKANQRLAVHLAIENGHIHAGRKG